MDVGVITRRGKQRRFAVSAGIGFDAAVCHEVCVSPWKRILNKLKLGKLSYAVVALDVYKRQVEGSDDLGFAGLPAKCQTYKSGSLAVQDMLNGNIQYVIIDAAPAAAITESINEMR